MELSSFKLQVSFFHIKPWSAMYVQLTSPSVLLWLCNPRLCGERNWKSILSVFEYCWKNKIFISFRYSNGFHFQMLSVMLSVFSPEFISKPWIFGDSFASEFVLKVNTATPVSLCHLHVAPRHWTLFSGFKALQIYNQYARLISWGLTKI